MQDFICPICGGTEYDLFGLYSCSACSVMFRNVNDFSLKQIKIKLLSDKAIIPSRAKDGDVGYDLCSIVDIVVESMTVQMIHTGVSVELPDNTEIQVRSRSGMGKKGIMVANQPGTIDTNYYGEICVLLYNSTKHDYVVQQGDKIAQLLVDRKLPYVFKEVDTLGESDRGSKGFGSTGR